MPAALLQQPYSCITSTSLSTRSSCCIMDSMIIAVHAAFLLHFHYMPVTFSWSVALLTNMRLRA